MTPRRLIEPARLAGTALLHTQTDERLVDMTRAGNGRAFEAIVARYRKPLLRYCGGVLPPGRSEDAVQQAFLNAYRAIVAGESELRLRPWLYRIAHNASLNLLRQNGWSYDQIPEDFDGVIQPPQAVEQSERIRELVRAVKDLPERQRDALILRELEGRSYEEISTALGVTGGAVRQLLNRARTTLRAAASAVTPSALLDRLAERGATDAPALTRIAEVSAGAGGAATLAKVGTAVVVAGAVAGGVVTGPLHRWGHGKPSGDTAQAAELADRGPAGAGQVSGRGSVLGGAGASTPFGLGGVLAVALGNGGQGSGNGGGVGGSGSRTGSRTSGTVALGGNQQGGQGRHGGGGGGSGGGSGHGGKGSGDGGGGHSGRGSGDGSGGGDHSGRPSGDGGGDGSDSGSTPPPTSTPPTSTPPTSAPPPSGPPPTDSGKSSPDEPPDPTSGD